MNRLTGEEVSHDPLKNHRESQEQGAREEEDADNGCETLGTAPAHEDHRECECRYDETHETECGGVGEPQIVVAYMWYLGCEIELEFSVLVMT